jgi:hypothetical protein
MMDMTKTLVVGQDAYMKSGDCFKHAKVTKVLSDGVEMKTASGPLRFDTTGKACDGSGWELILEHPDDRDPWERYWEEAWPRKLNR